MSNIPTTTSSKYPKHLEALFRATGSCRSAKLIFAIDATASRQPTWDMAAKLTAEMFRAAAGSRRARAATGLLPRRTGMHRFTVDVERQLSLCCDVRHHVSSRPYPDRPCPGAYRERKPAPEDRRRHRDLGCLRRRSERISTQPRASSTTCRSSCFRRAPTKGSPASTPRSRPSQAGRAAGLTPEQPRDWRTC